MDTLVVLKPHELNLNNSNETIEAFEQINGRGRTEEKNITRTIRKSVWNNKTIFIFSNIPTPEETKTCLAKIIPVLYRFNDIKLSNREKQMRTVCSASLYNDDDAGNDDDCAWF